MVRSLVALLCLLSFSAVGENLFRITPPTAETEFRYIWQLLQNIRFYEEHNYNVALPEGKWISDLKEKARRGDLTPDEFERYQTFFSQHVFKPIDYERGQQKIESSFKRLNEFVVFVKNQPYSWQFKQFETYQLKLTLYGPGGDYDPDNGTIRIFTTPTGSFKQYADPAYTIIHEVVHIGIEGSIIQKYSLSHTEKESIVDQIILLQLGNKLIDYKPQPFGSSDLLNALSTLEDIHHLSDRVEQVFRKK